MRVEDMKKKDNKVTIKDIEAGEFFLDWDGDLSMKIENIISFDYEDINAVLLSTGQLWACDENSPITPVKTHIVIESEENKK
jgi:hypothetical protein